MTLIDVHRHLWGFDWFPPSHLPAFTAEAIARRTGRTVEQVLERIRQSPTMDESGDGAVEEMATYGIDHSVIQVLDWGMAYGPEEDNQLSVEEFHRRSYAAVARHPGKLWAMCGVDARRPRAVAFLEECVRDYGAVGWKVYPPNGYQASDERLFPMYEKAQELDVPVLIHTGGNIWAWPEWVELVARRYPGLRILMGHAGAARAPFETGAYWRGLEAAQGKRNVWLDLCDWQALGAVEEHNLPQLMRVLRVFLDVMGPDRVVWGSDLPQTGVGSAARARTKRFAEIALDLPAWGARYGVTFTEEERDGLCHGAARQAFSNVDFGAADPGPTTGGD